MASAWEGTVFPEPHDNEDERYTPEDHQRNRRHYAAMIENIDRHVGRFIDLVTERDELDNTIIVYSSDHGEMLGDHSMWGKSIFFEPSVGVPFVIAGPGMDKGRTTDALVQLQDLTATFLDAAGADPLPEMEGRSLLPLLRGETDNHRRYAVSALDPWKAVIDSRYKAILQQDEMMLFDLTTDPWEDDDIAGVHPEILERMFSASAF
jgi:arylsulfatase A-like enzyme